MQIAGIQKLTLIDYPEKIACTLFLYGCNFRCGFCHNPELVTQQIERTYSEKEILDFLEKRKKYLEGVCITGGEPLLTLEKPFLKKIKKLGYLIKIDTNGSFPEKLKEFIDEGLVDFIAMDLKSGKEKYSQVISRKIDMDKIEQSIKLIIGCGLEYEFRTTILKEFHDLKEVEKMGMWLKDLSPTQKSKKFVLQGFQNKGKFIDDSYRIKKDVEKEYLEGLKNHITDFFEEIEIRA